MKTEKATIPREAMKEDEAIIERVLAGDTEAFRAIVEKYQERLLHMVHQFVGNRDASRDIAQDVFLSAYRSLRSYDPDRSRFSTWLFTIARNRSLNALRRKPALPFAEAPRQSHGVTPQQEAERRETFRHLDRALDALPDRQRRAFIFAELEGLPYQEIARIEAVSVGTVKSRVHRARRRLRSALREFQR